MNIDWNSHRAQLAFTAIAASTATYGVLTAYQAHARRQHRRQLGKQVAESVELQKEKEKTRTILGDDGLPSRDAPVKNFEEFPDQMVREQLARVYSFFGEEGMQKVRGGRVAIVGCGGVGSWAAVMLARSGVEYIRLIDFDQVTLSSLNRHATAMQSDVGTPKVHCIARTLRNISRNIEVDCRVDLWRLNDSGGHLLEEVDWVVDAIDNISTKVELLKYCHDKDIKIFSSMGAGTKCDPTRVQISDISNTVYDPLARAVRRRLRLQGVRSGIPVVYSTEVPSDVKLLPLPEEEFKKGDVKELGAFDDFRVRILPVLGPLPAIFGLHIASYVLCDLADKPIPNPMPVKGRRKLYERLYRDLQHREEKLSGQTINKLPFDEDDAGFIFDDLHRGRTTTPPHTVPTRPALVRWDFSHPLSLENCVVMEHSDAERHVKECSGEGGKRPQEVWGAEVVAVIARRAEEVKRVREWVM
ncbi:ubiquitin-protein ligase molybdopterin-converting factor [Trametopsis cervina]|nr:ubiquitin-protein ligase molybdopterin-converting factor [Trametopsis cervina]